MTCHRAGSFRCFLLWSDVLADFAEPAIAVQYRWQGYAIGLLVVFQQRRHDARECQRRAIECVQKLRFAILWTVAQLEAVGLVAFKVRARRNFQPALLS